MIEIDVLRHLAEHDKVGSQYVLLAFWTNFFDIEAMNS